jgi:putative DNA primase/helicase
MAVHVLRPEPEDSLASHTLTDAGNADRLVDLHERNAIYVPGLGWHVWDGRRWHVDEDGAVMRLARDTITQLYRVAAETQDEDARKALAKWATRSESERALKSMVSVAATDLRVIRTTAQLDANPHELNVANGILDLRTGELRAHDPDALCTRLAPVPYDWEADAPTWRALVRRALGGDENLEAFVQRAVGYSLTGLTSAQVLLLLWGVGANSKSTFVETIVRMLGEYARTADTGLLLADGRDGGPSPELLQLRGARLVSASEIGEGRRLDEARVKILTGGDTIAVRALYSNHIVSFRPAFTLWVATNHKPRIRETGEAIWRRMRLVPFSVVIPQDERAPRDVLDAKLDAEMPGILAWAVEGAMWWFRDGLGNADAVDQATAAYREGEDAIGAFLTTCCVLGPAEMVRSSDLYAAYEQWAHEDGEQVLSKKAFGQRLSDRGLNDHRTPAARWRMGVTLRMTDDAS